MEEWFASAEQTQRFATDDMERKLLLHSDEEARKAWFEVLKARRSREAAERRWVDIKNSIT